MSSKLISGRRAAVWHTVHHNDRIVRHVAHYLVLYGKIHGTIYILLCGILYTCCVTYYCTTYCTPCWTAHYAPHRMTYSTTCCTIPIHHTIYTVHNTGRQWMTNWTTYCTPVERHTCTRYAILHIILDGILQTILDGIRHTKLQYTLHTVPIGIVYGILDEMIDSG